jgi:CubicO group peptidase (beta-lactamase class C family)
MPASSATLQSFGHCAPAFDAVRAAFAHNLVHGGELGASLAVEVDGECVVDLWGGWADAEGGTPWQRDTLSVVFSNTKPATALCIHLLAEAGELDLDQPVARYWPAFAAAGKDAITPRMLLDHSAGLPALRERLPDGAAFDWDFMVERLEREAPFWAPGTRVGYHALTYGWLLGELVRRIGGCSTSTSGSACPKARSRESLPLRRPQRLRCRATRSNVPCSKSRKA